MGGKCLEGNREPTPVRGKPKWKFSRKLGTAEGRYHLRCGVYQNAEKNERDNTVYDLLRKKGIRCIVVWECTIKNAKKEQNHFWKLIDKIEEFLLSDKEFEEL